MHTPGPWTIDDTREYLDKACVRHNGIVVCSFLDRCGFAKEGKANARLIAAAPDLLEACKRLLAVVEQLTLDSPLISDGHTAAKHARAAIAKATAP